jgi:hypothetical protein
MEKIIENNSKLDSEIELSSQITRLQLKFLLFIIKNNACLSWYKEIRTLLRSCFPDNKIVNITKLYRQKSNIIIETLANILQQKESEQLKLQGYSILYDE